jgi:hypothetical protein
MKKMILLMASVFCSLGFAGNGGVSGGDPKAVEFLVIAKKVCPWAIGSVENQYPQIANCTQLIADLDSSLNGPEKAKLSFTDDPVFDQGVSKVAVFDLNQETITVNRTLWDSSTLQDVMTSDKRLRTIFLRSAEPIKFALALHSWSSQLKWPLPLFVNN